jgi:SRSO17 transposase
MADFMNSAAVSRLESYFASIGEALGTDGRRASFAAYAMGLLGGAERKSVEPIAALACADPKRADAEHQRLLHFMVDSPWSDRAVRRLAAKYGLSALTEREPVEAWIIDDTGFLKQGSHSVGVQRQYTGSAGKIANCQLATSLSVATRTEHLPIDFELYLPTSWTEDAARRREARVPDWVVFQTRPELALEMIRRAVADGVPPGVVLADCAYGSSRAFREGIRALDLHYIVAVDQQTVVAVIDKHHGRGDQVIGVRDLAFKIARARGFRRCTWRKGTKVDLSARFALRRVVPAYNECKGIDNREPLWLLIEWRDGETEPANYFFASLNSRMTKKQLIRLAMQRWRTERVYEDLKGELGLDHYEGRRYPGWHHHVSVALCCYAFIVAERVRRFPPSAGRPMEDHAHALAA